MPPPRKDTIPTQQLRLTQSQLADAAAITVTTLRQQYADHLPPETVDRDDAGRVAYTLGAVRHIVERRIAIAAGEDAAILSGPDTPAKQRLLEARADRERMQADMAQMERDRKRGLLLDAEEVRRHLLAGSQHLRAAAEGLDRRFGADAKRLVDEALDAWAREVKRGAEP